MSNYDNVSIAEALRSVLTSINGEGERAENVDVVDGLFAIAKSIDGLSGALSRLGTGDAATPFGAIEFLSMKLDEGASTVSSSIDGLQGD